MIDLTKVTLSGDLPTETGWYVGYFLATSSSTLVRIWSDAGVLRVDAAGQDTKYSEELWRYKHTWLFSDKIKLAGDQEP